MNEGNITEGKEEKGESVDWMRYSAILGNFNLVYRQGLISEFEYNRAVYQLQEDFHVVSHVYS